MSGPDPSWARLFRIARSLIRQVNANDAVIQSWSFGGGTAMMLQIDHRESHDVVDDDEVAPEAVTEFIAMKPHCQGSRIAPRDFFDIAAAATRGRQTIVDSLKTV
ncbi:MAG: hypothetical protein AB7P02_28460 [Alphaproteobacteria bacterium]